MYQALLNCARPAPIMLPQLIQVRVAQTKECQSGLDEDRIGDHHGRGHDYRRQGVLKDLRENDPRRHHSNHDACLDEFPVAKCDELATRKPRNRGPGDRGNCEDLGIDHWSKDSHDHYGENEGRDGLEYFP